MKKISILVILPSLAGGGAEKVTLSFLEHLDNKIFDVYLLLLNSKGPLEPKIKKENIINLSSSRFRIAFPILIKSIRKIKPEIIFSTFPHITLPLLIARILLLINSKIISREPNMTKSSLKHTPFSLTLRVLHKLLLPFSDKIIVNSRAMYNYLNQKGIHTNKLALIHNPIDLVKVRKVKNFIRYPGEGLRLIAMGRLVYQKGFDRIISILKQINNAHITILGEGPELNNLLKMVDNLNLGKRVDFIGYKKDSNKYIAAADYFILPSRWEGLPNAALESLVLGTPVISFLEVEGLLDIEPDVKNNNLYLCKNDDEMISLLKGLTLRSDHKNLILRNSLLNKFNSPLDYSVKLSKIIRELVL